MPSARDEIADFIATKEAERLSLHLKLNRLIAGVRRELQSAEVRGEAANEMRSAERDRATLARWSKATGKQNQKKLKV